MQTAASQLTLRASAPANDPLRSRGAATVSPLCRARFSSAPRRSSAAVSLWRRLSPRRQHRPEGQGARSPWSAVSPRVAEPGSNAALLPYYVLLVKAPCLLARPGPGQGEAGGEARDGRAGPRAGRAAGSPGTRACHKAQDEFGNVQMAEEETWVRRDLVQRSAPGACRGDAETALTAGTADRQPSKRPRGHFSEGSECPSLGQPPRAQPGCLLAAAAAAGLCAARPSAQLRRIPDRTRFEASPSAERRQGATLVLHGRTPLLGLRSLLHPAGCPKGEGRRGAAAWDTEASHACAVAWEETATRQASATCHSHTARRVLGRNAKRGVREKGELLTMQAGPEAAQKQTPGP